MAIIRPRIVDYYGIPVTQEKVSFAIPFLDEDIPLYLDPFLLWRSVSQQDIGLHSILLTLFNQLGNMYRNGNKESVEILIQLSECNEAGLGTSLKKKGKRISIGKSIEILELFKNIPQINNYGFMHIGSIQLLIKDISKDRISDIACNLLKSFIIDYTQAECMKYKIPMGKNYIELFDGKKLKNETVNLPYNPNNEEPILFIPKRWLRYTPWLNYDDYFKNSYIKEGEEKSINKVDVLNYNRNNYGMVETYISIRERIQSDCINDPLFKQIPIISAKRIFNKINKLPTGKTNNADKQFEDYTARLLSSLMYPHLDFAQEQSRTDSGTQIRDLIFYNNCSTPFLRDLYEDYECKQIVFEMKNVHEINRDHINQLNRYLSQQFGRFGIIVTRNQPKKSILKNTIDLWSGQRRCILCITDEELELMVNVYESKQRDPIEVIKKKYVEFIRKCPA